ncbi:hypothetical protein ILYODFUR_028348 [Ilyodon furcidens]|uniref:Uncharacterized protein n=1 Tax=Ilyodon furcidens TaxID=33524 RepID=A0ABV0STG8_9TELE
MADGKHSKLWLHFSKCDADYGHCNICDAKCKASSGNTSNLKDLVKHKSFRKAEGCKIFVSYRYTATTPALAALARLHLLPTHRLQPATWEKKCLKQLRCYNTNSWMLF